MNRRLFALEETEIPRPVNALTITDWRRRISVIVIAGLIVENNLAGFIVPDFEQSSGRGKGLKLKLELYTPVTRVESAIPTGVQSSNFSLL